ncbi:hypothetical protein [Naumannella cuiyingiana]|uniref:hypothetical protein n=1 Tax=Naumannella cuiyingiana TaxID=1347891 RepID=UPI001FE6286A|nr:hypothetical protein [Naumannella cuiyingiana]
MIAGQVCFCREGVWDLRVEVGEDACDDVCGLIGDVLFVVDGDALEECLVEDAAFSGFGFGVEVVEVGEDVDDLVQPGAGVGVGAGGVVEPVGDGVEACADAVLLGFEEVERDGVGVVGLDEFESFSVELALLGFEE